MKSPTGLRRSSWQRTTNPVASGVAGPQAGGSSSSRVLSLMLQIVPRAGSLSRPRAETAADRGPFRSPDTSCRAVRSRTDSPASGGHRSSSGAASSSAGEALTRPQRKSRLGSRARAPPGMTSDRPVALLNDEKGERKQRQAGQDEDDSRVERWILTPPVERRYAGDSPPGRLRR